jgi:hypothetical protein
MPPKTTNKLGTVMTSQCCPVTLPPEVHALVEEIGAAQDLADVTAKRIKVLQAELKIHTTKMRKLAELIAQHALSCGISDDEELSAVSKNFMVKAGKAVVVRHVSDPGLIMEMMGQALFLEKCTIGLGIVDQYLSPEQRQQVLTIERGPRSVAILPRWPPGARLTHT